MKVPAAPIPSNLPMGLKVLMIPMLKSAVGPAFSTLVHPTLRKNCAPHSPQSIPERALAPKQEKPPTTHDDDLDPMARRAAQLAPPVHVAPATALQESPASVETQARVSLEEILPALVRKIAWAGDGKRGSVRIELGAGELAGSTLLVHADHGKVKVELSVPPGVDAHDWQQRIHHKLSARGLDVESVEVE